MPLELRQEFLHSERSLSRLDLLEALSKELREVFVVVCISSMDKLQVLLHHLLISHSLCVNEIWEDTPTLVIKPEAEIVHKLFL